LIAAYVYPARKSRQNFGDRAILGDRAETQRNEKKRKRKEREKKEKRKRKEREKKEKRKRKERESKDFQVKIALRLRPLLARICSRLTAKRSDVNNFLPGHPLSQVL
jgi:hypothetical protein